MIVQLLLRISTVLALSGTCLSSAAQEAHRQDVAVTLASASKALADGNYQDAEFLGHKVLRISRIAPRSKLYELRGRHLIGVSLTKQGRFRESNEIPVPVLARLRSVAQHSIIVYIESLLAIEENNRNLGHTQRAHRIREVRDTLLAGALDNRKARIHEVVEIARAYELSGSPSTAIGILRKQLTTGSLTAEKSIVAAHSLELAYHLAKRNGDDRLATTYLWAAYSIYSNNPSQDAAGFKASALQLGMAFSKEGRLDVASKILMDLLSKGHFESEHDLRFKEAALNQLISVLLRDGKHALAGDILIEELYKLSPGENSSQRKAILGALQLIAFEAERLGKR